MSANDVRTSLERRIVLEMWLASFAGPHLAHEQGDVNLVGIKARGGVGVTLGKPSWKAFGLTVVAIWQ